MKPTTLALMALAGFYGLSLSAEAQLHVDKALGGQGGPRPDVHPEMAERNDFELKKRVRCDYYDHWVLAFLPRHC